MKYYLFILLIALASISFSGCESPHSRGGDVVIEQHEVLVGTDGTKETTTTVTISQPDDPKTETDFKYEIPPGGGIKIAGNLPASTNVAEIIGTANLLKIPMYAGIAMLIAGGLVWAFLKNIKWGATLGVIGMIMIVGSYLLAKFAVYFMLGLVALVAFGLYLLWDYIRQRNANSETVKTIQAAKETGAISDPKAFAAIADSVQGKGTKSIVAKIKGKKK